MLACLLSGAVLPPFPCVWFAEIDDQKRAGCPAVRALRGKVGTFVASTPCQEVSSANQEGRVGFSGERSSLFILAIQVLVEDVVNLASHLTALTPGG